MKPLEITQSGAPLSQLALANFERNIGSKLPEDYKRFLLKSNGGKPKRNIVKHTKEGSTRIVEFHALSGGTTLRLQTPGGFDERPARSMGIAIDCGGNPILLSLAPHDYGYVYWKDHEEPSPNKGLSLIAKSFGAFADMLTPEPPRLITDPVERLGKFGTKADLDSFLQKGGKLESRSREGLELTLIHEAARHGNLPFVKTLVARGASTKDLLHYAVKSAKKPLIDYVLDELGADVNEKSGDGYTPTQFAHVYPEIQAYLASRGARG